MMMVFVFHNIVLLQSFTICLCFYFQFAKIRTFSDMETSPTMVICHPFDVSLVLLITSVLCWKCESLCEKSFVNSGYFYNFAPVIRRELMLEVRRSICIGPPLKVRQIFITRTLILMPFVFACIMAVWLMYTIGIG